MSVLRVLAPALRPPAAGRPRRPGHTPLPALPCLQCSSNTRSARGAHARGLAGYWRTVPLLDDPPARALLGIEPSESVLGLVYLGAPVQEQRPPEREPAERFVSYLD